MLHRFSALCALLVWSAVTIGQNPHVLTVQPVWTMVPEDTTGILWPDFEGAGRHPEHPELPIFRFLLPVSGEGAVICHWEDTQWEPYPGPLSPTLIDLLGKTPLVMAHTTQDRTKHFISGFAVPMRVSAGQIQRLVAGRLTLDWTPPAVPTVQLRGGDTEESVLASGTIYKLAIPEEGVYRMTYDFLKNTVKMPVDQIDPRRIHLYGNGGAMLPRSNAVARPDDLTENALYVHGGDDGVFDPGDYILFYAHGPHPVETDVASGKLTRPVHLYDTRSHYFLKVEAMDGLRIPSRESLDEQGAILTDSYDDVQRLEDELVNLLDDFVSTQGSGSRWFGDRFSATVKSADYSTRFRLQGLVPGHPIRVRAAFASRSDVGNRFSLQLGTDQLQTGTMNGTQLGNIESLYATNGTIQGEVTPAVLPPTVVVNYTASGTSATGWIDYLELQMRRVLSMDQTAFLRFTDLSIIGEEKVTYRLTSVPVGIRIWDITNPLSPVEQTYTPEAGGAAIRFTRPAESLAVWAAFDPAGNLPTPTYVGLVVPQNLHGILEADMLVVYHPDLEQPALQLADHRRSFSGLQVETVRIDQVYNEFSSGSKDPMAIRDLARMLYQRDSNFHYLLLFGDASFDARNLKKLNPDPDRIPVFESDESLDPINSLPTDDLYGLMGDNEGGQLTGQSLDIAIGRLPVETTQEAQAVVDKIIRYDTAPEAFGDWRLRAVFLADDEDNNLHLNDADVLAVNTLGWQPDLNVDKIYLDAYKQLATPGGQRYPDANKAFNNAIFRGALLVNYIGHGGPSGWTQERVVQLEDIQSWSNPHRMPLILTATCTFAAFDNPAFKSGGEQVLLNANGGGIALFSTVRPVYASQNKDLANRALQELFAENLTWEQPIGEILRSAKNKRGNSLNDRKFLLLGDPAQVLAYPRLKVSMTRLNGKDLPVLPGTPPDTIKALQTVTIEGRIEDHAGQWISDFNGIVYPTLFDKPVHIKTLGNDPKSFVREFSLQKNILAKGAATVEGGLFQFTFTLPQDIVFQMGQGKFSFYAWDEGMRDAAGSFEDFILFGVDETTEADLLPPVVDVFMNGPDWAFGGLTGDRPVLYAELYDDSGFNISGTGIGQDAVAILNEDTRQTFVLNDFFEPVRDDYRRGVIRYPLSRLEPGRYRIMVRAWDIFSNPGEGYTEFVVGSTRDGALAHVLNYPNPVTDFTRFRFEHNLAGQTLRIQVDIHDMNGRPVKTLVSEQYADSNRISELEWDGLDRNGLPLPSGIYVYKIRISALDGLRAGQGAESALEKLVLLK